jgi:hypothetical protein
VSRLIRDENEAHRGVWTYLGALLLTLALFYLHTHILYDDAVGLDATAMNIGRDGTPIAPGRTYRDGFEVAPLMKRSTFQSSPLRRPESP